MSSETEAVRSDYALWKQFIEHPCWKRYEELVKSHLDDREKAVRQPVRQLLDFASGEFIKGELAMAEFLFRVPALELERLEHEIELLNRQEQSNGRVESEPAVVADADPIGPGNNPFRTE